MSGPRFIHRNPPLLVSALADQAAVRKEPTFECCSQPTTRHDLLGLAFYQLQLKVYAIVICPKNYDHHAFGLVY